MHVGSVIGRLGLLAVAHAPILGCAQVPAMTPDAIAGGCQRTVLLGPRSQPATQVRWIAPQDAGDRRTLAEWCRTVGPALVAPSPAPLGEARVTTFAVLSWNQHVGGGDIRRLVDDLRAGALTDGVPVHHFVLLLQETFRSGAVPTPLSPSAPIPHRIGPAPEPGREREDIRAIAGALDLALFYAPSMRNGQAGEDRGNAILSTMPLENLRVVTLPFERQRRATVMATVLVAGGGDTDSSIEVASIHLDVWPATIPSLLDGARRLRQSAAFLSLVPLEGYPTIIGADLNALSSGDPHVGLYRARWPDWEVPSPCRTRGLFCTDYLFAGGLTEWELTAPMVISDRYGSDHRPVLTLAVRREPMVAER